MSIDLDNWTIKHNGLGKWNEDLYSLDDFLNFHALDESIKYSTALFPSLSSDLVFLSFNNYS